MLVSRGWVQSSYGRIVAHVEAVLKRFMVIGPVVLLGASAAMLRAQDARESSARVPAAYAPPAGLCRLWIEGVPPSQQPAPTDCASAIKNRPSNASVVFGPQRRGESSDLPPFTRRTNAMLERAGAARSFTGRAREESRERSADTTAKSATRKPDKPQ